MATQNVEFRFITGLKRPIFRNGRLFGSWDSSGRYSDAWTESPMQYVPEGEDGCPVFTASVALDLEDQDKTFKWGVFLDGPQGANFWGIPTEISNNNPPGRHRAFHLDGTSNPQLEEYYFTYSRRLGANKHFPAGQKKPGLRFGVWAPNATKAEVVFGKADNGYIADDGSGIDPALPVIGLSKKAQGIWEGFAAGDFEAYRGAPYMYRLVNAQGNTVYRTDIFSRNQIGCGKEDPGGKSWTKGPEELDGGVGCSQVIDPDVVRRGFASTPPGQPPDLIPAEDFWATEFTAGLPVPARVEDLVIYELHIGSLGFGKPKPGNLEDAMAFLDHVVDLGVNTIELLPMAEYSGEIGWGYGDTHHLCIETSAGGRDKYRHFIRECHRRGIAVIQDVVYNHYDKNADRAEWQYDSTSAEQNIYYWYERRGNVSGYVAAHWATGFTPRYWEEVVRQQFISSAAFLVEEMHVDGFRVDLTSAMHAENLLNGKSFGEANMLGQRVLREWCRTLQMIRPTVMLMAEDHSGWPEVVKPLAEGGLGFDARWKASFYHDLIGDSGMAGGNCRLLKCAGDGGDGPLPMDRFSGTLYDSKNGQVVYHEAHDEVGNADGTARTMKVAVNGAPLVGDTRLWAEARSRVCFGLSLLSAGTPMFVMGEEIGAQKDMIYTCPLADREDILGERGGNGKFIFRFYQDLIALSRGLSSIRSRDIDILHQSNANRVIAFKRWRGNEEIIIVASLNNHPFLGGYVIEKDSLGIPDGWWKEIFNSDAAVYGGWNVGNCGASIPSSQARLNVVLPASGLVVLARQ